MGASKGTISVRRYAVLEPLPEQPKQIEERFMRGLRAHAFVPLDPRAEPDRSVGWVVFGDPESSDLRPENVFFPAPGGLQLRVALRIDVLRPPAAEVRRQTALRAAELEAQGRRVSPRERRALREELARKLKLRAFPRVRVVDLIWSLDVARFYFWSQTRALNEAMLDMYAKSFGLRVTVEDAGRWSAARLPPSTLTALEPTPELWQGFSGVRPLGLQVHEEAA